MLELAFISSSSSITMSPNGFASSVISSTSFYLFLESATNNFISFSIYSYSLTSMALVSAIF